MLKYISSCLAFATASAADLQILTDQVEIADNTVSGYASFTYYDSYPKCCPNNPNYDPKASKEECDDYSGCKYSGDFAAIGHKSFDYVKSHDLVAFYDNSNASGSHFLTNYGGKTITLTKGSVSFTAVIADTCGNGDCNNCCAKNSQPSGYLLDMEYYTILRHFGSTSAADGQIHFSIGGVTPAPTPEPCSWAGHCKGDPCSTYNDCDGAMTCVSGKCA